jgi:hypothetical protein
MNKFVYTNSFRIIIVSDFLNLLNVYSIRLQFLLFYKMYSNYKVLSSPYLKCQTILLSPATCAYDVRAEWHGKTLIHAATSIAIEKAIEIRSTYNVALKIVKLQQTNKMTNRSFDLNLPTAKRRLFRQ